MERPISLACLLRNETHSSEILRYKIIRLQGCEWHLEKSRQYGWSSTKSLATASVAETTDAVRPYRPAWLEIGYSALTFRLMQVLTGHDCFGSTCAIGRIIALRCHHSNWVFDDANHTVAKPVTNTCLKP